MKAIMKSEPAEVLKIALSRKFLRNCTSGANSEPKAAVEIKQPGNTATVVSDENVDVEIDV